MSTRISIVKNSITNLNVDAIVNAANTSLLGGGGVDGAIHREAGNELYNACKALNGCNVGEAKITRGYNLKARYVIHTVGPQYKIDENPATLLKHCYINSLYLAIENNIKTIAFPAISTGVYKYPIHDACKIATDVIFEFCSKDNTFTEIIFCLFDDENYKAYCNVIPKNE